MRSRRDEDRELAQINDELTARGMLRSGAYRHKLTLARERRAETWNDEKARADRKVDEMEAAEGRDVKLVPAMLRRPWPENLWGDELPELVAAWENPEIREEAITREVNRLGLP